MTIFQNIIFYKFKDDLTYLYSQGHLLKCTTKSAMYFKTGVEKTFSVIKFPLLSLPGRVVDPGIVDSDPDPTHKQKPNPLPIVDTQPYSESGSNFLLK